MLDCRARGQRPQPPAAGARARRAAVRRVPRRMPCRRRLPWCRRPPGRRSLPRRRPRPRRRRRCCRPQLQPGLRRSPRPCRIRARQRPAGRPRRTPAGDAGFGLLDPSAHLVQRVRADRPGRRLFGVSLATNSIPPRPAAGPASAGFPARLRAAYGIRLALPGPAAGEIAGTQGARAGFRLSCAGHCRSSYRALHLAGRARVAGWLSARAPRR